MKRKTYLNKKFNKLTIIKEPIRNGTTTEAIVKCDCGKITKKKLYMIIIGNVKSCGCLNTKANRMSETQIYKIYRGIIDRCNKKNDSSYKNYGGRGIKNKWSKFIDFYKDMGISYKRHIKKFGIKNTSIDRINNNKDYSKENCRWATYKQQQNNTRKSKFIIYKNKKLNYTDWAKRLGVTKETIRYRAIKWDNPKKIIETPFRKVNK